MKAKRGKPPATVWLQHLLHVLASQAVNDLRRLAMYPDEMTHALRVRMKKFSAVLCLAADKPKRGKVGALLAQVRAIKGSMAGNRDEHVIAKLAKKLNIRLPPKRQELRASGAASSSTLLRQCRRLLSDVASLSLEEASWKRINRRHHRTMKRAARSCRECLESDDAEAFHRWRKRVKTLYFQSLSLHDSSDGTGRLRRLAKLAHELGNEHDLSLLAARLDRKGKAWKRVEKKRRELHERLRKSGHRLFADDGGR